MSMADPNNPIELLTIDQLARVMPKNVKSKINQDMVDQLNGLMHDPKLRENYRDNLLSYTSVMKEGRFKIQSYLDAVRYVSYKLLGDSNIVAYSKTFPDRYQRLLNEGADDKKMSSYSTAYNKTILVNKIMEQTLIPCHILNMDLYQKAINTQAVLMVSANSEKVRSDAANSLLTHLKPPEIKKVEIDLGVKEDRTIEDLRDVMTKLANNQVKAIVAGEVGVRELAHSTLIEVAPEAVEVLDE